MAAGDSTRLVIELETVLRNLNKTLRGLDQVKRKLESVANVKFNQRTSATSTEKQALAAQRLAIQQQRLQLQQQRLATQTTELANRQERARQATERLARSGERLSQSLTTQARVIQHAQRQLGSLSAAALRVGGGLRSLGLTASVTLTAPLTALAVAVTRNAVEFDSLRRGLTVMAGSAGEAERQLARLTEIAKAPGIGFQEAIQGSIRLQAVGFSARDAEKALIQFANAVALTGGGRNELERVTVQLGQLAAKGKVVAQDLKPIIEAAPAVGQALLKAFGTVNSEDIQALGLSSQEFFDQLTDALSKLPRAAAGARNAFENFSDALFRASLAIGDAILPPLTRLVDFLEPIITRLAAAFRELPQGIQIAIVAVGVLAAALGPVLFIIGGLASGIGAIGTALATLIPLLGTIGLPAIAALVAGLGILLTQLTIIVTALGLAWRNNFLGIRELVSNAAGAVLNAFNRIRAVIDEATRRILPTLQSITTKVIGIITAAWEKYGKTIVAVVGEAFRFIVDVTVVFLRAFTDFVDLVLKLIDGDWKGAWQAFSRIVISAIDNLPQLLTRLLLTVTRAMIALSNVITTAGVRLAIVAQRLAVGFVSTLAATFIREAPKLTLALENMFLNAALSINATSIATLIVARILAAMREAASRLPPITTTPEVSVDIGAGEGLFRKAGRQRPPAPADAKGENILRRETDRLREAQDRLAEQREKNRINLVRSAIEQQFSLTKDGLERESRVLDAAFEDRLKTVRAFFAERKRIQEAEIDSELEKEKGLSGVLVDEFAARRKAIQAEFETARAEIQADPKLKGRARILALQTAELNRQREIAEAFNDFETQNAEISTRILTLQRARKDIADEILRAEAELTRELQKQQEQLRFDLAEEQGLTADAETGRLKARFTETLRDLRIDVTGLSAELQDALNSVNISVLQQRLNELPEPVRVMIELLDIGIKRAQIAEAQQLVDDLSSGLRLDEERIRNRVLDGLINQRQAQAEILAVQRRYRALLLDILRGELAKAEAIKDQGVIIAIQAQIAETERLGVAIDEIGQQINQSLFSDLQSGISGIFSGARRGFEGLRDAAISFGERLLDTLNDIAATSIVRQLEDLFKPDATNTKGTIGGFLSKLFGLGPSKQADAAAASATLQSGAVGASAALSTGVATASATFTTSVVTSATSFAATIIAAGAAFAASIAAAGVASGAAAGGAEFARFIGGGATGMYPAVPGGVYRFVEGGYPEAVLTTDPKHAANQVKILKAFLRETRGLGGRIHGLATGGFAMPELSINTPNISLPSTNIGELAVAGAPSTMRLRQVLVDERDLGNWVNSAEGEQVLVDFLYKKAPVIRKIGGK